MIMIVLGDARFTADGFVINGCLVTYNPSWPSTIILKY